ncbi:MAG: glycosyltransferase, partial [Chloroflexota bacterium]
ASREEGGPKAVLECIATGVPLVTSKVGLAPDVIQDGINGYMTEVEDVGQMVCAIESLYQDHALAKTFVMNGLKTAAQYTWNAAGRRYYEEVYAPLLSKNREHPYLN